MTIHQEIFFKCSSKRVFEALLKADQFGEFSGSSADIDPEPGGEFHCFGGMISGQSIEIEPCKKLIQEWRVGIWDPEVYSIVRFELEETGPNETKLIMNQTGFPEEHRKHLEQGWYDNYWEPMKKYLKA